MLAAAAIAVSGAIGVYHAGVELGIFEGLTTCTSTAGGATTAELLNSIMKPRWCAATSAICLLGISMALERDPLPERSGADRLAGPQGAGMTGRRPRGWRPGDRRPDRASMLRVDQAGEYGATRIYAGQLAVLRQDSPASKLISRMNGQEQRHLERFNALMAERRVRPTALQPVWNVAGFALGAATALMSEKAAMACTDAVETEIDRHYSRQLEELGDEDPEFAADIRDSGPRSSSIA